MARIPDTDRTIFSNIEKTISDRFTKDELDVIHKAAETLEQILNVVIAREDPSRRDMVWTVTGPDLLTGVGLSAYMTSAFLRFRGFDQGAEGCF